MMTRSEDKIPIHTIIRNRRKIKGYTQKALAEALNVSDKTVSKWETGRGEPDVTMVKRLSMVLDIPIEAFFSRKHARGFFSALQ